jgi:hypothetical protein
MTVPSPMPRSTEGAPISAPTPLLNPGREGGVPRTANRHSAPMVPPHFQVGGRYPDRPFGSAANHHFPVRPPPGFPEHIPTASTYHSGSSYVVPPPRAKKIAFITVFRWIVLDFLNCSFSREIHPNLTYSFIHSLQDKDGNPIDLSRFRSLQPMPMPRTWETQRGNPYPLGTRAVSGYSDHRTTTAIHHGIVSVMPPPRAKKATIITVRSIHCDPLILDVGCSFL